MESENSARALRGANDNGQCIQTKALRPTRIEILAAADALLRANPEPRSPSVRNRYRGTRPAMNWLRKHDENGAAALWLVARERLPREAANDNQADAKGMGVDRRKDNKPRGRSPDPRSLEAYLALPSVEPRLGDAELEPVVSGNWDAEFRGITIKPQHVIAKLPLYPFGRFTKCRPAIAPGAFFLGAMGGLGQPKMGKTRGDIRWADEGDAAKLPAEIDAVIEAVLAGGNVADIGRALGAHGGYADRRGGAALLAAGQWARRASAA